MAFQYIFFWTFFYYLGYLSQNNHPHVQCFQIFVINFSQNHVFFWSFRCELSTHDQLFFHHSVQPNCSCSDCERRPFHQTVDHFHRFPLSRSHWCKGKKYYKILDGHTLAHHVALGIVGRLEQTRPRLLEIWKHKIKSSIFLKIWQFAPQVTSDLSGQGFLNTRRILLTKNYNKL